MSSNLRVLSSGPGRTCTGRLILAALLVTGVNAAGASNPLIEAVKQGRVDAVRAALKQTADVNAPEPDGMTALHWAARSDHAETVDVLIRAGAKVNAANRYGITPLSLAALNGNARITDRLIAAGADVNAALPDGETVLMTAARAGNPQVLRSLLVRGANANAVERTQRQTAVTWAALENNAAAIRILAEAGADLHARSATLEFPEFKWIVSGMVSTSLPRGGWTPLMFAAREGSIDAARALAEAGADLNQRDPEGSTALIIAVVNAHFDLASTLIDKGADPNVADLTGMTALYAAVDMHTLGPMLSRPVPKLVDRLDSVDVVKALLAKGANPNPQLRRPILGRHHDNGDAALGEGSTPLMRAARSNDVAVMRLLLAAGANPSLTQRDYTNALMMSAAGGGRPSSYVTPSANPEAQALEAVTLCVEHGADVNAFNANGQTAIHSAALRGADSVVRYLAGRGARLNIRNKQGRTPLELASGRGGGGRGGPAVVRDSTVALLKQLGAR